MLNKRGNIPIFLCVVIFIVLAVVLLFTFLSFNGDFEKERDEFNQLRENFEFSNAYIEGVFESSVAQAISASSLEEGNFESNFNENFKEIVNNRDLRLEYGGNFFGKVRNSEYILMKNGQTYTLTMEVLISSNSGASEMKRDLTLSAVFENEN